MMIGFSWISKDSIRFLCWASNSSRRSLHSCNDEDYDDDDDVMMMMMIIMLMLMMMNDDDDDHDIYI